MCVHRQFLPIRASRANRGKTQWARARMAKRCGATDACSATDTCSASMAKGCGATDTCRARLLAPVVAAQMQLRRSARRGGGGPGGSGCRCCAHSLGVAAWVLLQCTHSHACNLMHAGDVFCGPHMCRHAHMHTHTCIHRHTYAHAHVHTHTHINTHALTHKYACTRAHTRTHMHTRKHTHTQVHGLAIAHIPMGALLPQPFVRCCTTALALLPGTRPARQIVWLCGTQTGACVRVCLPANMCCACARRRRRPLALGCLQQSMRRSCAVQPR